MEASSPYAASLDARTLRRRTYGFLRRPTAASVISSLQSLRLYDLLLTSKMTARLFEGVAASAIEHFMLDSVVIEVPAAAGDEQTWGAHLCTSLPVTVRSICASRSSFSTPSAASLAEALITSVVAPRLTASDNALSQVTIELCGSIPVDAQLMLADALTAPTFSLTHLQLEDDYLREYSVDEHTAEQCFLLRCDERLRQSVAASRTLISCAVLSSMPTGAQRVAPIQATLRANEHRAYFSRRLFSRTCQLLLAFGRRHHNAFDNIVLEQLVRIERAVDVRRLGDDTHATRLIQAALRHRTPTSPAIESSHTLCMIRERGDGALQLLAMIADVQRARRPQRPPPPSANEQDDASARTTGLAVAAATTSRPRRRRSSEMFNGARHRAGRESRRNAYNRFHFAPGSYD